MYIIPCAIHETIAMPAKIIGRQEVLSVVKDVNEHAVLDTDFRSDNIYYYDREKHILRMELNGIESYEFDLKNNPLFL